MEPTNNLGRQIERWIERLCEMVRKCRGLAKIAVMEVDVRTTRPPPDFDDVPPTANNRPKKITTGTDFEFSTTSFVKLPSWRRRVLLPDNSVPMPPSQSTLLQPSTTSTEDRSSTSPTSDDNDASGFCCSSNNGCSEIVEESTKFVDLEYEKNEHGRAAFKSSRERETTLSRQFRSTQSGDMESPAGKSEGTSGHRSLSSSVKMPAESELEEFFIAAEKSFQKRFAEKYNYDIVEDVPLEGRYEWIRLKP